MTTEAVSKLNHLSAKVARDWLDHLGNSGGDTLSHSDKVSTPEVVVVPIPDLSPSASAGESTESQPPPYDSIGKTTADSSNAQPEVATASRIPADSLAQIPTKAIPLADISETTADWIEESVTTEKERPASKNERGTPTPIGKGIKDLTDKILNHFPLAAPRILAFVGADDVRQIHELGAQIANELANRHVGKILLVDSRPDPVKKTAASRSGRETGLLSCLGTTGNWKDSVCTSAVNDLDRLPTGGPEPKNWTIAAQRLQKIAAELKKDYQFICLNVADAHTQVARLWAGKCDGAYLVIQTQKSSRTTAQSAVAELSAAGARVLGCVLLNEE